MSNATVPKTEADNSEEVGEFSQGTSSEEGREIGDADDDDLRRMMADLQQESSPAPETSAMSAIEVKTEKMFTDPEAPIRITIETSFDDTLPGAQSSPSYAAAKWAAKLGSGSKSTPVAASSPSTSSTSKSWRDDFVAAVQENKLKRKAEAAAKGRTKKKRKLSKKSRPVEKKSPGEESFDSTSAKQGKRSRATEFTAAEKDLLKEPLIQGWKRELVYRKTQKKGNTADVYYIPPNGLRLRSLPEVCDYLRTANEKVTAENFSFRRIIIGFGDIEGAEIVRGRLAPELASMESEAVDIAAAKSATVKKKKKTVATSAKNPKIAIVAADGDKDCESSDCNSGDEEGSSPPSQQHPTTLLSLSKDSSAKKKTAISSSSSVPVRLGVAGVRKKSSTPSPIQLGVRSPVSTTNRMQQLRKVAISESQRQRNTFLKSIAVSNIPIMDDQGILAPVSANTKGMARKSIPSPRSGDGNSHASSARDGSEMSSEYRVPTCDDQCPVVNKWPSVLCKWCLRLFHKDCVKSKGRIVSTTLQFECTECVLNGEAESDDSMEDTNDVNGSGRSAQEAVAVGPTPSADGDRSRLSTTRPIFNPNVLPTAVIGDLSIVNFPDSGVLAAAALDKGMPVADRAICESPALDMAVESDEAETPALEIIINGNKTADVTDLCQESPVAFQFDRFNDYIKALVTVFKYLPVRDLLNVRLVCKAWQFISSVPEVWKYARLKGCRVRNNECAWSSAIKCLRDHGVRELDLVGCSTISMNHYVDYVLPALSRFVIGYHYGQVMPKIMEATAAICRENLRRITMTLVRDPSSSVDWISSSILTSLTACTELVELRLSAADAIGRRRRVYFNGDGLVALNCLTKLRILTLFDIRALDETAFDFLPSLTALRILEIGDCQCWTRETYFKLRRLTNLRRLRLEYLEPGAAGEVLADSLLAMKELREAEFVRYSFDYSYMSSLAAQPLLALTALPFLHTLRLYPDLDGKWPAPTWRRTIDVIPHYAGLKRLELGLTMEESASTPPPDTDLTSASKPPFMCTKPRQQQRIAYMNKEALREWISEKLPNTVVNMVDCLLSSELTATRVAKWW